MRIVAIIPARGGSQSIPRKNLVKINEKPLIGWTIEAALKSKYVSKTIVTSEDEEILHVSTDFGASTIVRPLKYSTDQSMMVDVVLDSLKQLENQGQTYDTFILLQPTSPGRNAEDIDRAIRLFQRSKATGLISGYVPEKSPYKAFRLTKLGWLRGLVDNIAPFNNRQQLPPTFYPNGAIYIFYIKEFLTKKSFLTTRTIPYLMPSNKNADLDTITDLKKYEDILKKR